jgi:anti-sigma factor RsiW
MDEHTQDQIEAYLTGHMEPKAKSTFESQLAADPELQTEVALHSQLMGAIETEMLRRDLQEMHEAGAASLFAPDGAHWP